MFLEAAWSVHGGWWSLARQPVDVIRAAWNVHRGSWGLAETSQAAR